MPQPQVVGEPPPFNRRAAALAGAGLGAVGAAVPILIGAASPVRENAVPFVMLAAVGGEVVGIPLGVWLADRRRGDLGRALLTSAGIMAVGMVVGFGSEISSILVLTPVVQLFSVVSVEERTRR